MKKHVHKLPVFRHPGNKSRAVLYPVHGTRAAFGVLVFDYRQRYARTDSVFPCRADAVGYIKKEGFK